MPYTPEELQRMYEYFGMTPNKEPTDEDKDSSTEEIILMDKTDKYALGVHSLREACINDPLNCQPQFTLANGSSVYRPCTFKETLEKRIIDYETAAEKDRLR